MKSFYNSMVDASCMGKMSSLNGWKMSERFLLSLVGSQLLIHSAKSTDVMMKTVIVQNKLVNEI